LILCYCVNQLIVLCRYMSEDKPTVAVQAELFPFVKLTTDFYVKYLSDKNIIMVKI